MRIFSKILLCFSILYIVHCILYIPPVFAQESTPSAAFDAQSIGSSKLDPSNLLYFLKAVREKMEIKFAGTEKVRVLKRLEFAERRLREINSLIAVHREDLVRPNLEKFLTELTLVKPVKDKYLNPLVSYSLNPTVSDSLGHYMQVLIALHGNLTDSKARLGVRSAIYRLMDFNKTYYTDMDKVLAAKLFPLQSAKFATGCNLLADESLNSSLNESERQILKERGEKCKQALLILQ